MIINLLIQNAEKPDFVIGLFWCMDTGKMGINYPRVQRQNADEWSQK